MATKEVTLLFPHQLYHVHEALEKTRSIVLVEESLFFTQYRFHKTKLIFHRASMKAYQQAKEEEGYTVHYWESHECPTTESVFARLAKEGYTKIHVIDPTDDWLEQRIQNYTTQYSCLLVWYESGMFFLPRKDAETYMQKKTRVVMKDFYQYMRKRFGYLMEEDGTPKGGKWSYDEENRKALPKGMEVPEPAPFPMEQWRAEATEYVTQYFPNAYGENAIPLYAITHKEAWQAVEEFLQKRFVYFGPYEDAIAHRSSVLFHSVLSPLLNCALLTPKEVLDKIVAYGEAEDIPLSSQEGLVRQILGWREFVRGVYHHKGRSQRTKNALGYKRTLTSHFWEGTTGILPFDETVRKIQKTAYAHHIERLMVCGNLFFLLEIHPDKVYRWFMELFIDAYDWVMVPNVYGMSQYADGGHMVTKPYFSGGHYLEKMGDYPKGAWKEEWDSLFWCAVEKHTPLLEKNYRLRMLTNTYKKAGEEKKAQWKKRRSELIERIWKEKET